MSKQNTQQKLNKTVEDWKDIFEKNRLNIESLDAEYSTLEVDVNNCTNTIKVLKEYEKNKEILKAIEEHKENMASNKQSSEKVFKMYQENIDKKVDIEESVREYEEVFQRRLDDIKEYRKIKEKHEKYQNLTDDEKNLINNIENDSEISQLNKELKDDLTVENIIKINHKKANTAIELINSKFNAKTEELKNAKEKSNKDILDCINSNEDLKKSYLVKSSRELKANKEKAEKAKKELKSLKEVLKDKKSEDLTIEYLEKLPNELFENNKQLENKKFNLINKLSELNNPNTIEVRKDELKDLIAYNFPKFKKEIVEVINGKTKFLDVLSEKYAEELGKNDQELKEMFITQEPEEIVIQEEARPVTSTPAVVHTDKGFVFKAKRLFNKVADVFKKRKTVSLMNEIEKLEKKYNKITNKDSEKAKDLYEDIKAKKEELDKQIDDRVIKGKKYEDEKIQNDTKEVQKKVKFNLANMYNKENEVRINELLEKQEEIKFDISEAERVKKDNIDIAEKIKELEEKIEKKEKAIAEEKGKEKPDKELIEDLEKEKDSVIREYNAYVNLEEYDNLKNEYKENAKEIKNLKNTDYRDMAQKEINETRGIVPVQNEQQPVQNIQEPQTPAEDEKEIQESQFTTEQLNDLEVEINMKKFIKKINNHEEAVKALKEEQERKANKEIEDQEL